LVVNLRQRLKEIDCSHAAPRLQSQRLLMFMIPPKGLGIAKANHVIREHDCTHPGKRRAALLLVGA
jgi:hypothetical protein